MIARAGLVLELSCAATARSYSRASLETILLFYFTRVPTAYLQALQLRPHYCS